MYVYRTQDSHPKLNQLVIDDVPDALDAALEDMKVQNVDPEGQNGDILVDTIALCCN